MADYQQEVSSRKLLSTDIESFQQDLITITASILAFSDCTSGELLELYNTGSY